MSTTEQATRQWNRYYVAWAASNGRTPAEQFAVEDGPTGSQMAGFIVWIPQRWAEFDPTYPEGPNHRSYRDREGFCAWLAEQYPAVVR